MGLTLFANNECIRILNKTHLLLFGNPMISVGVSLALCGSPMASVRVPYDPCMWESLKILVGVPQVHCGSPFRSMWESHVLCGSP
jgi:hypothetical protein